MVARYQHSRHLVAMLNTFADAAAELPAGWERKLNKEGKVNTYSVSPLMFMCVSDTLCLYIAKIYREKGVEFTHSLA